MRNLFFRGMAGGSIIAAVCLVLVPPGVNHDQTLASEGKVYWAHRMLGVGRSNLDGSNVERLVVPDLRRPAKIVLDVPGGKMYWSEEDRATLYRSNLDGSNTETFIEESDLPQDGPSGLFSRITDVTLDPESGKVYRTTWYNDGDVRFHESFRANLDGSDIQRLDLNGGRIGAVDGAQRKLYYVSHWDTAIHRVELDSLRAFNSSWEFPGDFVVSAQKDTSGLSSAIIDVALDVARGKIYWVDSVAIHRADLDGANVETVIGSRAREIFLDTAGGKIYWTTRTIQRANLDGSDIEIGMEWETVRSSALDLNQGRVYWTGPRGTIQRATFHGKNVETLFAPEVREPYSIALDVDKGKMYWSDVGAGSIHRANLDGSNAEVLLTGLANPKGIALLDGRRIYWADSGTSKIQAANLDGLQVEDIATDLHSPDDIVLDTDGSKIYWTNMETGASWSHRGRHTGTIQRSNLNGSLVEEVATGQSLGGIAFDGRGSRLFWTSATSLDSFLILERSMDGSAVEEIVTSIRFASYGGGQCRAIALDLHENTVYWGAMGQGRPPDHSLLPPVWMEIGRSRLDGSGVEVLHAEALGTGYWSAPTGIALDTSVPTAVSMQSTAATATASIRLEQNVPNPFNSTTRIPYHLTMSGPVRLEIYNALGQRLRTLVDEVQPAGFYQVLWDARPEEGSEVSAGVYLARLRGSGGVQTRRLLLLK